ncbi:hypothetical protein [Leifsonia poae]|uniref:Uncharacterized protein n=1 Tax=Leifsonia poae TaxID=110933 RepID=A0A9W6LYF2_9MICO|nr:hypothetical protein [Leifsonia poae]GLJ74761.1 hypothetical protein GCM10017584_03340 [Leifsonia poae]
MTADSQPDKLDAVDELIGEVKANLPRRQGTTGIIVGDEQTQRIIKVLELLRDEVRSLKTTRDNGDGIDPATGKYHVVD